MKRTISFPLVVFLETFILYFLAIIPAEYLLTEKFLIFPTISAQAKTGLFATIFFVIFIFNYFNSTVLQKSLKILPFLVIFFVAGLLAHRAHSNFYSSLQSRPKIFAISSNWGIQAMPIVISGKNFGPAWARGEVYVDDVPLIIEDWSEEEIVAKLPVPPRHFRGRLFIIGANGEKSNSYPFEIRNPDFLKGRH
jgi:hypothetical protein